MSSNWCCVRVVRLLPVLSAWVFAASCSSPLPEAPATLSTQSSALTAGPTGQCVTFTNTRTKDSPDDKTFTFQSPCASAATNQYTLVVDATANSANVSLNGREIWGPSSFKGAGTHLESPVTILVGTNTIVIRVKSSPGSAVTATLRKQGFGIAVAAPVARTCFNLLPPVSGTTTDSCIALTSNAKPGTAANGAIGVASVPVPESQTADLLTRGADWCNNSSTDDRTIIYDVTLPALAIGGFTDGEFRSGNVTPTYSVTDINLVDQSRRLTLTTGDAYVPAGPADATNTLAFTSGQTLSVEGGYALSIDGKDCATNTNSLARLFTIDKTPPRITLGGVNEAQIVRDAAVTPTFQVVDRNLASVSAMLTLLPSGASSAITVPFASGTSVTAAGHYSLAVTAVDKAGNQSSASVGFNISICGNQFVEPLEDCESPFDACCLGCNFRASDFVCRPNATGSDGTTCDVPELCTGTSAACPADIRIPAGTTCRGSSGPCDIAATCDGVDNLCHANPFKPPETRCRDAAGVCDQDAFCSGSAAACPANPFKPNSTICRGSAGTCDVVETCTGASPDCPSDALASAGTFCRSASKQCDADATCTGAAVDCPPNPTAADGKSCDDGNGCTKSDVCVAGACSGAAYSCSAPDQCHQAGTCNGDGTCSYADVQNGTSCSAGSACAGAETCQSGACVPCAAHDQCHSGGTCNAGTGQCEGLVAVADGTSCNDGDVCTQIDACQSGVCTGANPLTCSPPDACHVVVDACDKDKGCVFANAADGTACTTPSGAGGTCTVGACATACPATGCTVEGSGAIAQATVVVPAGAVAEGTRVSVTQPSAPAAGNLLAVAPEGVPLAGPLVHFSPSGTQFDHPVTITVPKTPGADTILMTFSAENPAWTFVPSIDNGDGTVTAQVWHFSVFANFDSSVTAACDATARTTCQTFNAIAGAVGISANCNGGCILTYMDIQAKAVDAAARILCDGPYYACQGVPCLGFSSCISDVCDPLRRACRTSEGVIRKAAELVQSASLQLVCSQLNCLTIIAAMTAAGIEVPQDTCAVFPTPCPAPKDVLSCNSCEPGKICANMVDASNATQLAPFPWAQNKPLEFGECEKPVPPPLPPGTIPWSVQANPPSVSNVSHWSPPDTASPCGIVRPFEGLTRDGLFAYAVGGGLTGYGARTLADNGQMTQYLNTITQNSAASDAYRSAADNLRRLAPTYGFWPDKSGAESCDGSTKVTLDDDGVLRVRYNGNVVWSSTNTPAATVTVANHNGDSISVALGRPGWRMMLYPNGNLAVEDYKGVTKWQSSTAYTLNIDPSIALPGVPSVYLPQLLPTLHLPTIDMVNLPDFPNVHIPPIPVLFYVPGFSVNGISIPGLNLPIVQVPFLNVPGFNAHIPAIQLPDVHLPDVNLPGFPSFPNFPSFNLPGVDFPTLKVDVALNNVGPNRCGSDTSVPCEMFTHLEIRRGYMALADDNEKVMWSTCSALRTQCRPNECGNVPDGCGGTLACAACCVPRTQCNGQCGNVSDGCGGTLSCGACCTPRTQCNGQCGNVDNGCGGSLWCGECQTCTPSCSFATCGSGDGCGGTCQPGSGCISLPPPPPPPPPFGLPGGSYAASCVGCFAFGTTLNCLCYSMSGELRSTSLDYGQCVGDIGNNDGVLGCQMGAPPPPPPPPPSSSGTIHLRAFNGNYVVAEGAGGGAVNANRPAAGDWETFVIGDLNGGSLMNGDQITLQTWGHYYVTAESAGGSTVVANRTAASDWETFTLVATDGSGVIGSGSQVALRTWNGANYLTAENGGGAEVVANRTAIGPWEIFTLEGAP